MSAASLLLTNFPGMTRDLGLESPDGLTTATVRAVLRPMRPDELEGSAEQMMLEFTAEHAALAAAGFDPLRKDTRIIDGTRRYTIEEQPRVLYAGEMAVWVKAAVKG